MVNFLWMDRQAKFFSARRPSQRFGSEPVCALSSPASLDRLAQERRIAGVPNISRRSPSTVTSAVHRFEESIAGRDYLIEVASVSKDRWRAYIVRIPGVPTALMPFYGTTPADAAHQLCEWLTRAHARAANPSSTV
jgi:hypothetical protein